MSVALCLLAYTVVVAVLAPPLLLRTAGDGQHPRLGLVAWLSAIISVLLSWAVAVVFLSADVVRDLLADQHLDLGRCFRQLHDAATGVYGAAVQVGLWALAGLAVIAVAVATWRLCRSLVRARSVTHQHAHAARMVGRRHDRHDAVVLDHPEPAAYSVAGNPHTIVLTQGIVATLDEEQLGAVMAHERAHLNGRHHLLLAFTRALASVFPRIELFVTGAAQVGRLVEMIADDAAAEIYGPIIVCEALLTLADSPGKGPVAATEVGLADRVRRLAEPPALTRMNRFAASAAIAAVILGPMIATLAAAGGIGVCALGS
ncbi:M56 family metallopeptidase [Nocardia salmonicida]|uniref:M56 family metallopeptidase n=1 Tax=Nocardia salmonicida TaxID=53431 RepID=UPI00340A9BB4